MNKKILIISQKVDTKDNDLSFFVHWIKEFSKYSDPLTVICLKKGEYSLPENVKVLSLGKESKRSKILYILNFYKYIIKERNNYDSVFVHMNEEYVLLGAFLWKMWGKKITMWRNHKIGTFMTPLAVKLSNQVFCTSPKSYTAKYAKTKVMPAGIDTSFYEKNVNPTPNSILFFGRLSPVKNVHVFIESLVALDKDGVDFKAEIVGSPSNSEDYEYEKVLLKLGDTLVKKGKLKFNKGIPYEESLTLYSKYSVYVNLTPDGSLDKTMLEAMSAHTPVLLSNSAFRGQIPEACQLASLEAGSASEKIKHLLSMSQGERQNMGNKLFDYVHNNHSLEYLVDLLVKDLQ
ncbi:MAG: glycosyltransferase family 4 protein [Minisyncoccia bacterium]